MDRFSKIAERVVRVGQAGVSRGQRIRDTKTGITYVIDEVVRPRGGGLAYVEAIDRRGRRVRVDAEMLGGRYVFSEE